MTQLERVFVAREASAPMLRYAVEARRGRVILDAPVALDEAVQWMQNGTPIAGEERRTLHLAELTPDDGDVYYAVMRSPAGEVRSQSVLVVVMPGHPLLNVSARGIVTAEKPLILGFVVGRVGGPVANKRYLLRVVGGSLRKFGVTDPAAKPRAVLHRGRAPFRELGSREDSFAIVGEQAARVGAFALQEGAGDLADIVALPPGGYSLFVTGVEGSGGEVLAEVYELPD